LPGSPSGSPVASFSFTHAAPLHADLRERRGEGEPRFGK
jgi:hypothetical protein